jgi:uncharacterized membrane protein
MRTWRLEWVVWALIGLYLVFFGILTVLKHDAFQTTAFDLGNVDQAVWNTRHGRPFAMTNIEGLSSRLGTHVEPIILPIALLYLLWSDPRVLLLLQTAVIGLGAWPVYLLAKRKMSETEGGPWSQVVPAAFACAYLLFPALQSANVFDFHAMALAPTFFLFALYFLETECWAGYALFGVLTMSCKEDMPLLVVMLGLYALLIKRNWRVGLATILLAATWFLVAVGWIMPHFDTRGVSPLANRYAYLGDNPLEMAVTLLTRPELVVVQLHQAGALPYLRDMLLPVAFLSLLAPQVLLMSVPTLAVNLLSTDGFMHQLEGFHYGAPLAPIVVVSGAYGVAWLMRRLPRFRHLPLVLVLVVLAASLVYHRARGYTPLAANSAGTWPVVSEHHRLGHQTAELIPPDASLAALPHPNPHASQRQEIYMIDRVEEGLPAPLHDSDLIWLDVTNSWPLHPNDLKVGVENLLFDDYGIEQAVDGWLLLERGGLQKELPGNFYDFARASGPQPQYSMSLRFLLEGEPVLEGTGFDLELLPGGAQLTFYWRALQPLPEDLRLWPFYVDDATGQVLEDTSLRPLVATAWYEPHLWEEEETIKTSTLPWDVGDDFSVGLGVMRGDNWSEMQQRLPIHVESSDLVTRLFDDGTWARLLQVQDGQPVEERRLYNVDPPQHELGADLGGMIRLLGYDLDCDERPATCTLDLYWQAVGTIDRSYTVFAQLIGQQGIVRSQVDSVPQGGGYPSFWWLPGEIVIDSLSIPMPEDASPDATYHLITGLYDAGTGARLSVTGSGADYVDLGTVSPQ